jgi:NodT family efflux transporter outer membrane factor (OMF) lipoprotein
VIPMKPTVAPLFMIGLAALAGCNLAPPYAAPKATTSSAYKEAVAGASSEADQGWKLADPKDTQMGSQWWEVYQDPQLNELEERVAVSNQTVVVAEAAYRAARALVSEAEASLFPTLSLVPSVTRSRSSASVSSTTTAGATTGVATTGGTATTSSTNPRTIYSLPLEASYQIDLWGSVRNTVAQNRYSALASGAQVATALLSTQTSLAQAYFELRVTDEQRRVLDTTLADYRASLHLVRSLSNNGLASDEDLSQAEAQLAAAEAQATDLGVARAQYEHAIAVLVGVPPASFSLPYRRLQQALPVVPVGVPSDLLERRPDIAAAERQVAATNAGIGIARAAYFPSLTLSASGGYQSTSSSSLFDWPSRFWSVGPQLAQTIFDGGARRAATAQARALNDEAAATYRETVLTAFQSVEDNLAALRILSLELKQEHNAVVAAQRTVELSIIRYRNGVDSYVNVITAQNTFLTNRETELQVQLKQLTASVNLINNLGGGWSTASWGQTERLALHPPVPGSAADVPAAPGTPNPPAIPEELIRPDELLRQDQESVAPAVSPTDKRPR